jgi:hypothetical protein
VKVEEHLLACLSEECVEISKEAHKALRFGIDDTNPTIPNAPSQRQQIVAELNDLLGVVELLVKAGILPENWSDQAKQLAKQEKVARFIAYARQRGAIDTEKLGGAFESGVRDGMAEIMAAKEREPA